MLRNLIIFSVIIHVSYLEKQTLNLLRNRRFVKYPKGSAVGYIVALAIPTEDVSTNVYLAFNFEANFILPNYESGISQYFSKKRQDENVKKRSTEFERNNNLMEILDVYSSIKETFTRKNIYSTLESQLFLFGLNGTACILKTICQTTEIPIYESNGVFGTLFHIIFTPSSSEDEELPAHVYEAEKNGITNQCNLYDADCPKSILDFVAHTVNL